MTPKRQFMRAKQVFGYQDIIHEQFIRLFNDYQVSECNLRKNGLPDKLGVTQRQETVFDKETRCKIRAVGPGGVCFGRISIDYLQVHMGASADIVQLGKKRDPVSR